jgi:hypothetical protein
MAPTEPRKQHTHVVHFETIRIKENVLADVIKRGPIIIVDPA